MRDFTLRDFSKITPKTLQVLPVFIKDVHFF